MVIMILVCYGADWKPSQLKVSPVNWWDSGYSELLIAPVLEREIDSEASQLYSLPDRDIAILTIPYREANWWFNGIVRGLEYAIKNGFNDFLYFHSSVDVVFHCKDGRYFTGNSRSFRCNPERLLAAFPRAVTRVIWDHSVFINHVLGVMGEDNH